MRAGDVIRKPRRWMTSSGGTARRQSSKTAGARRLLGRTAVTVETLRSGQKDSRAAVGPVNTRSGSHSEAALTLTSGF